MIRNYFMQIEVLPVLLVKLVPWQSSPDELDNAGGMSLCLEGDIALLHILGFVISADDSSAGFCMSEGPDGCDE